MHWLKKQNLNRYLERVQKRVKNGRRQRDELREPSTIVHEQSRQYVWKKAHGRALNKDIKHELPFRVLAKMKRSPNEAASNIHLDHATFNMFDKMKITERPSNTE